ncbi:MAG: hypothetical protein IJ309_00660 [Clostridia bacterium]|nr:hypothetical protein [Clostridia bacterium]
MRSNHTTLRAVGFAFAIIGIIATAVLAVLGFQINPVFAIVAIILGVFATVVCTCMFFALANIQENQGYLQEFLNERLDRLEKENIAIFEKLREMNGEPPMDQPTKTTDNSEQSTYDSANE